MQEISNIQNKLEQLIARYNALKEHAAALEIAVTRQEEEIKKLSEKRAILIKDLQQTKTNGFLKSLPEVETQQLKGQLDTVLKLIEDNIQLLK